jgi:hypothetical protein
LFPADNEGLLGQVLALADTTRSAVGDRAEQRLIPRHDVAERLAASLKAFDNQFGIRFFHWAYCIYICHIANKSPDLLEGDKENDTTW